MSKREHLYDLHLHKGGDSLEQIVRAVKKSGKKVISVVDKENIDNISVIEGLCKKYDLSCVRGVEVNARYEKKVYHFFVYNFKRQKLLKRLFKKELKAKFGRAMKVAKKLERLGWQINWSALLNVPVQLLGRRLVVENIRNHPANLERLLAEEVYTNDDFYRAYLNIGRPAYFDRKVLGISLLIRTAHKAGGIVVWAHPVRTIQENFGKFKLNGEFTSVFTALKNAGIDGLEVYYPGVSEDQVRILFNLCRKNNLFATAGSDSVGSKLGEIPKIIEGLVPDDIRHRGSLYRGVS